MLKEKLGVGVEGGQLQNSGVLPGGGVRGREWGADFAQNDAIFTVSGAVLLVKQCFLGLKNPFLSHFLKNN